MKKFIAFLLPLFILLGCIGSGNFNLELQIVNKSNVMYDSVKVYVYPNNHISFYNMKPNDTIFKVFKYRNFTYSKGERTALVVYAYKDDYYYELAHGVIDSPFALLEDKYMFYLWDNGIHTKKDVQPLNNERHKRVKFREK